MSLLISEPDNSAYHFLGYNPNPLRYEYSDPSPYEAHNTIAGMIPQDARVIEIGCGTGILGEILRTRGICNYEGIEPSKPRAAKALSKSLSIHNCYLDKKLALRLGRYDVIILADVIEHLESPHELLEIAKDLMKSNATLIISVPNIAHWSIRLQLLAGSFNYTETGILDATHLRWFTIDSLTNYLARCGFEIKQLAYTPGYTLPAYSFLRSRYMRFLSDRRKQVFLNSIVRRLPPLFACQLISSCRLKSMRGAQ